jgi:hypothetical protein
MPYSALYKKYIEIEKVTSIPRLRARKLYKITSYKYVDGHTESFNGSKSVYIFVLGIFKKKLYALKVSEIQPEKFFKWLKTAMLHNLTEASFHNLKWLENLVQPSPKSGSTIFNTLVKGKPIYTKEPHIFRTYNLQNIKQIMWVEMKTAELEKIYGIKHVDLGKHEETPKQIQKVKAVKANETLQK